MTIGSTIWRKLRTPVWRLTGWYVLIIMVISLMFSGIIYRLTVNQLRQSLPGPERFFQDFAPRFRMPLDNQIAELFESEYQHAVSHIRLQLIVMNLAVLAGASIASYFLAKRTLRPIERALDDQRHFTADASHELRTPLAAIKTEVEVALKTPGQEHHRAVLTSVLEETRKLEELSGSLLHLARHEDPAYPLPMAELAMTDVVQDALARMKTRAVAKHIRLTHVGMTGELFGNRDYLTNLLVILLDNAVKYSPENTEVVIHGTASGSTFTMTVHDRGDGIAPADIPHVFQRFYRADASRSKQQSDGFGLGLSIAKQIVEQHHGSISIDSTVGQGTTVTVILPGYHS